MTFSEASESVPTFEGKEEKNKEIGEIKPEGREADETAKLVDNAHKEPEVLVELAGNVEQAEAIESAVVKTVEAPVAIVDQAVEAAMAKQEQSGGDAAIDTVPLPETPAEEVSQPDTEDGGDVAIDTVPLPEQPAKMESAEAIIDPNDSPSATEKVDSAAIIDSNDSPHATEKVEAATIIDPNDAPRTVEASAPEAIIDSNDAPSDISASEIPGSEAESVAIGTRSTPEEPADDVLRGAGEETITGEYDDNKSIDLGPGKEAFIPVDFLIPWEGLGDLPGIGSDMGLGLGSISEILFGESGMTPDDLKSEQFPDAQFGKSKDNVLKYDRAGSASTSGSVKITDEMTDEMDSNGKQDITRHETYETDTDTTTIDSQHSEGVTTKTISVVNKDTGATYTETSIDGVNVSTSGDPPAPPDESTPHPEDGGDGGGYWGPPESSYDGPKLEVNEASPFDKNGSQQGWIMQPSDEGGGFDEDRTLPISLEKALDARLDPWINPVDDIQGTGGSHLDDLKPKGVLGDPAEGMGEGPIPKTG